MTCRSATLRCLVLAAAFLNYSDLSISFTSDEVRANSKNKELPMQPTYSVNTSHLVPITAMNEYMQLHSEMQLRREWSECGGDMFSSNAERCSSLSNRTFVVADYNCPNSAGNEMFMFMNRVLWAMASNRTVLWRYRNSTYCAMTCAQTPMGKGDVSCESCATTNNLADCEQLIKRWGWIPSFDKWGSLLGLPAEVVTNPSTLTDMSQIGSPKVVRITREAAIWIGRGAGNFDNMVQDRYKAIYGRLRHKGDSFLYGMLFFHLFHFADGVLPHLSLVANASVHSTAVHSRHPQPRDHSNLIQERCLDRLLGEWKIQGNRSCVVYIMTDREEALKSLSDVTLRQNCTPLTAQANSNRTVQTREHTEWGPFAGGGFFLDLALASNARDAFISTVRSPNGRDRMAMRSSTQLILALAEYQTVLERNKNLQQCLS